MSKSKTEIARVASTTYHTGTKAGKYIEEQGGVFATLWKAASFAATEMPGIFWEAFTKERAQVEASEYYNELEADYGVSKPNEAKKSTNRTNKKTNGIPPSQKLLLAGMIVATLFTSAAAANSKTMTLMQLENTINPQNNDLASAANSNSIDYSSIPQVVATAPTVNCSTDVSIPVEDEFGSGLGEESQVFAVNGGVSFKTPDEKNSITTVANSGNEQCEADNVDIKHRTSDVNILQYGPIHSKDGNMVGGAYIIGTKSGVPSGQNIYLQLPTQAKALEIPGTSGTEKVNQFLIDSKNQVTMLYCKENKCYIKRFTVPNLGNAQAVLEVGDALYGDQARLDILQDGTVTLTDADESREVELNENGQIELINTMQTPPKDPQRVYFPAVRITDGCIFQASNPVGTEANNVTWEVSCNGQTYTIKNANYVPTRVLGDFIDDFPVTHFYGTPYGLPSVDSLKIFSAVFNTTSGYFAVGTNGTMVQSTEVFLPAGVAPESLVYNLPHGFATTVIENSMGTNSTNGTEFFYTSTGGVIHQIEQEFEDQFPPTPTIPSGTGSGGGPDNGSGSDGPDNGSGSDKGSGNGSGSDKGSGNSGLSDSTKVALGVVGSVLTFCIVACIKERCTKEQR